MTEDPTRWKDAADAPDAVHALLREGARVPPMSDEDRAGILTALAALPVAPLASVAKAPALASSGASTVVTGKVVMGMILVTVAGGVGVWLSTRSAPRSPSPVQSAPIAESAPQSSTAREVPSAEALAPSSSAAERSAPAIPSSNKPVPRREQDSLTAESALVGRARTRLETDPAGALASLEEHARTFPNGELAPERDFLTVKALRRVGRTDDARTKARAFLKRYPSSPYAGSVRNVLSELER